MKNIAIVLVVSTFLFSCSKDDVETTDMNSSDSQMEALSLDSDMELDQDAVYDLESSSTNERKGYSKHLKDKAKKKQQKFERDNPALFKRQCRDRNYSHKFKNNSRRDRYYQVWVKNSSGRLVWRGHTIKAGKSKRVLVYTYFVKGQGMKHKHKYRNTKLTSSDKLRGIRLKWKEVHVKNLNCDGEFIKIKR